MFKQPHRNQQKQSRQYNAYFEVNKNAEVIEASLDYLPPGILTPNSHTYTKLNITRAEIHQALLS